MKFYDVDGYDRPLQLSTEHAELLGGVEHETALVTPGKNAPKASWIDYAVALGEDPVLAEAMTKAELIDQYAAE